MRWISRPVSGRVVRASTASTGPSSVGTTERIGSARSTLAPELCALVLYSEYRARIVYARDGVLSRWALTRRFRRHGGPGLFSTGSPDWSNPPTPAHLVLRRRAVPQGYR